MVRASLLKAAACLGAVLVATLLASCGDFGVGDLSTYRVRVNNGGTGTIPVIVQLPDRTVQRTLAPGATIEAFGYKAGVYTVTIIIQGDARAAYVANLTALRDLLRKAISASTGKELETALGQIRLVDREVDKLRGSGLPACSASLTDTKRSVVVGLAFNVPIQGQPGVWIPSCG